MPHLPSECFASYEISTDSRWPKEIAKQQLIQVGADCGSPQWNRRYRLYYAACSVRSLPHQHSDPPLNSRRLLRSNSAHITEFTLTPSLRSLLKECWGFEGWFHRLCGLRLAISVNGLCCPKESLAGGQAERSWDLCVILNASRTVFRDAVRALFPLQLETLSRDQLNETEEKAPPREGAYLFWLSVRTDLDGLFFLKGQIGQSW